MVTVITNASRRRQIGEFVDVDHEVMGKFYELLDEELSPKRHMTEMKKLIEIDPDFYDPYLDIAEILSDEGKKHEAKIFLIVAYERAVQRIADSKGRWPKEMLWGYLENRHLMRALHCYADACWEEGDSETALDIYRRLLRVNPHDNQGVRYQILAIRMGLGDQEWSKPFEVGDGEYLDAIKVIKWFAENALKFPEEFDWLLELYRKWEE